MCGIVGPSDILSYPDDDDLPTSSRRAKYGVKVFGIPLGSPEYMDKFVKDKFNSLRDEWSGVLSYHDPQSAWLMFSMCLAQSINHLCRQVPPSIILKHASIFDDNLRKAVNRIQKIQLTDLEWERLKLPYSLGGCDLFNIYNVAVSGFVASYEECFKHTAAIFPVINELRHSNDASDCRITR